MECFVYILQSEKNDEYYVGSTEDVESRLNQHNSGNVQATRNKAPYKIVFFQCFESVSLARRAEMKIKSWKRRDFIEKIIKQGKIKFMDA
ncbi:MAG: GIY-YIG nuclease family protein [Patescibacteria group bacterium]